MWDLLMSAVGWFLNLVQIWQGKTPPTSPTLPTPAPTPAPAPAPTPAPTPAPGSPALLTDLLNAHNQERRRRNAPPLELRTDLIAAAQSHADWMARVGILSHYGENGAGLAQRLAQRGIRGAAGENIALGYTDVAGVLRGWRTSPGHRDNLLRADWAWVGFGRAAAANRQLYWVAIFLGGAGVRMTTDTPDPLPAPLRATFWSMDDNTSNLEQP